MRIGERALEGEEREGHEEREGCEVLPWILLGILLLMTARWRAEYPSLFLMLISQFKVSFMYFSTDSWPLIAAISRGVNDN
jgi:hypothetical protein